MTTYQVNSEAVLSATSQAKATIARVQADLHQLTANLQALESSWSGQAAAAFQGVLAQWRSTQIALEGELIHITDSLEFAAQHYIEMEQANARLFLR